MQGSPSQGDQGEEEEAGSLPSRSRSGTSKKPIPPLATHGFAAKYAPSACLVVNRSLQVTMPFKGMDMHFVTLWDLLLGDWPGVEPYSA